MNLSNKILNILIKSYLFLNDELNNMVSITLQMDDLHDGGFGHFFWNKTAPNAFLSIHVKFNSQLSLQNMMETVNMFMA